MRSWLIVIGIVAVVTFASAAERHAPDQAKPSRPCKADVVCCPAALGNYGRVGFHGPPPKLITRVEPDLSKVARPYPCGVAILELGVDLRGDVVSSCIMRGVRDDFDQAVQAATRKWRYTASHYEEAAAGIVMTVTVEAPDRSCHGD